MSYQKETRKRNGFNSGVEVVSGQRPIEDGLKEIKTLIGDLSAEVLPEGKVITTLSKEDFQSPTFLAAAYDCMQDIYGNADRHLYLIDFTDGSQTFITTGKVSSDNPFEVGHASIGGLDLRKEHTHIYQHDNGFWNLIVIEQNKTERSSGAFGKPKEILPEIRQALGKLVRIENFTRPQK